MLTSTERNYSSSPVNMLTNSLNISDTTKTEFFDLNLFQGDENMPCIFGQSFGPFNVLSVHKYSDVRLFKHLSNYAF